MLFKGAAMIMQRYYVNSQHFTVNESTEHKASGLTLLLMNNSVHVSIIKVSYFTTMISSQGIAGIGSDK